MTGVAREVPRAAVVAAVLAFAPLALFVVAGVPDQLRAFEPVTSEWLDAARLRLVWVLPSRR